MSNHTPGPWELEAGRNFKTTSGEFYITYSRDRYDNPKFKSFVELDNNAVLIAAAPDMYTALKAIAEELQEEGFSPDSAMAKVWQSLAKAEGKL